MPFYVWIKLSEENDFDRLACTADIGIRDVAALACASRGWGPVHRVRVLLLASAGEPEPSQQDIAAALQSPQRVPVAVTLESLGVASGAWLLAVRSPGPELGGGGGGGGAAVAAVAGAASLQHQYEFRPPSVSQRSVGGAPMQVATL
jgi:hypothetical protein